MTRHWQVKGYDPGRCDPPPPPPSAVSETSVRVIIGRVYDMITRLWDI